MRILKFFTQTCRPCKLLTPLVEEVCHDLGVTLEAVDCDENEERADLFDIRSVPTLVAVDGDDELSRLVGMHPKARIKTWIKNILMEDYEKQVKEHIRANDSSFYLLLLRELEYYQLLLEQKDLPPGCLNPSHVRALREESFRRYENSLAPEKPA